MLKINFEKLKWVAENAFWIFLILVFLALILGGATFYKYYILVEDTESEIKEAPLQFNKNLYQNILAEWQIRGERLEVADSKKYPDLFEP